MGKYRPFFISAIVFLVFLGLGSIFFRFVGHYVVGQAILVILVSVLVSFFTYSFLKRPETLRLEEAHLQAILDHSPALISIKDLEGNVVLVNRNFEVLDGPPPEEFVGKNVYDLFPYDVADALWKNDLAALQANRPVQAEEVFAHKDGTSHTYLTIKFPLYGEDDQAFGICAISTDITGRVQAEEALRESEERFRMLLEQSPLGIEIFNPDGVLIQVNKAWEKLWGAKAEEVVGKYNPLKDPQIAKSGLLPLIERVFAGEPINLPDTEFDPGLSGLPGQKRYVRTHAYHIKDTAGQVQNVVTLHEDITERMQAQQAVQKKTRQQEHLIEAARHLTASLDVKEVLSRIGSGAREILRAFGCTIYILEEDGNTLTPVVAIEPLYEDEILATPLSVEASFTGQAVKARRGLIFNDAGKDFSGYQIPDTPEQEEEHVIVTPFVAEDEVLGAMTLSHNARRFSEEDLALAEAFAAYAVTALKNARAHRDLQYEVEERKRAEEALRESEARYRNVVEDQTEFIVRWLPDGTRTFVNGSYCRYLGQPRDELIGSNIFSKLVDEDRERIQKVVEILTPENPVMTDEHHALLSDGSVAWQWWSDRAIFDAEGQVIEYQSVGRDITEQVRTQEALRESEEMLRLIFENAFDGISVYQEFPESGTRSLVDCNTRYAEIAGRSKQELLELKNTLPIQRTVGSEVSREEFVRTLQEEGAYKGLFSWVRPDGKENIIEYAAVPVLMGGRVLTVGIDREITDRKRSEAEILRLQHLLQNITDSMPSALITLDPVGQVLTWNPAAEALTGRTAAQVQGQSLWQTCPELIHYRDLFERVISEGQVTHLLRERVVSRTDVFYRAISVFPLEANGIEGAVLRIDDVTQRVQLEEMMLQSAKMASVGRLAAGVAHELNNPLGAMMQSAQMLQMVLDTQRPRTRERLQECDLDPEGLARYLQARGVPEYLDGIRTTGERAAKIVSELLSFSRKSSSKVAPHNVNVLVEQTLELAAADYDLRRRYDFRNIQVVRELAPDLPKVICDRQQIQQVVLNLVRNAAQAMAGADGMWQVTGDRPQLTLRTALLPGSETSTSNSQWVRLEVEDNGPGVPEAARAQLFEPFFTTKDVGEGTGLGLWLCWSIVVERHEGRIWHERGEEGGSRFVVELPVA